MWGVWILYAAAAVLWSHFPKRWNLWSCRWLWMQSLSSKLLPKAGWVKLSSSNPVGFSQRKNREEDFKICGQNHQIQVFPASGGERVHQEEVWGFVQHAPAAVGGGPRTVRHAGGQHPSAPYWQDLVRHRHAGDGEEEWNLQGSLWQPALHRG